MNIQTINGQKYQIVSWSSVNCDEANQNNKAEIEAGLQWPWRPNDAILREEALTASRVGGVNGIFEHLKVKQDTIWKGAGGSNFTARTKQGDLKISIDFHSGFLSSKSFWQITVQPESYSRRQATRRMRLGNKANLGDVSAEQWAKLDGIVKEVMEIKKEQDDAFQRSRDVDKFRDELDKAFPKIMKWYQRRDVFPDENNPKLVTINGDSLTGEQWERLIDFRVHQADELAARIAELKAEGAA